MKILHTSDWHLGHQFHSRRRETEFEQFLHWLLETIRERRIDALIVAGDLFDSSAPSNAAMRLYCDFLLELQSTPCRLAVLTGGNHDSPSFLNAPRELLKAAFPIEIFGGAAKPEEELVVLRDRNGDPELIVGAVPYLRDGDLTTLSFGEATAEREKKLAAGMREHYRAVAAGAEELRAGREIPVVLTGHLFLAGGRAVSGDGMREYIGGIGAFDASLLPESPDYYALGHIHQPQKIGRETIRYSGSPLKMSFSDTAPRTVCEVEFTGRQPAITLVPVPAFADIRRLRGSWETLEGTLREIAEAEREILCEVTVEDLSGTELMNRLDALFRGRMKNHPLIVRSALPEHLSSEVFAPEDVAEMEESEIFDLLLERRAVSDENCELLRELYRQTLLAVHEEENPPAESAGE